MFNHLSRWSGRGRRRQDKVRGHEPARPLLEVLEDRIVPAVYNVNSTQDLSIAAGVNNATGVINGTSGVVTLRSAIQAANHTTGPNTINLTLPGTYAITLKGTAGETDNQAGEFSIFPTVPTGNLTIDNTSGGAVLVDGGGGNRVFDINAGDTTNPATASLVTFEGFTIKDGFASNAANPDGPAASGGAIRDQGNQSLTLTNMVLTNNAATADGGGVSMENTVDAPWTLTLNNTTVSGNNAGDAGGGVETDGSGKVVVNTSTITGNTSVNQGAGIWLDAIGTHSANLTITNSTISSNNALNGPTGGIGNAGNGAVSITGSTIASNTSGGTTTGGGGFGDENSLGTLTVLNSTFANNSSTGSGGGLQENGPSTTINDSTFTGNTTLKAGGGMDVTSATFVLNNTIVAHNSDNGGPDPDVVGAVTSGRGNFISVGGAGLTGITNGTNGNQIGTAAASLDPKLGPLQNNGGPTLTEAPLVGSPVINAGVNAAVPVGTLTDQRGFLRVIDGTVDVGAVEFQNVALAVSVVPQASKVTLGGKVTLFVNVTNTSSARPLPDDNSTLQVTLPPGLTATSPLSFTLGALGAGKTATFTVTARANSLGTQKVNAVVSSPDTTPAATTGTGSVVVSNQPSTPTAASTSTPIACITDTYTLLSQIEKVTAQVMMGSSPVSSGQVLFTDNGQSQTVNVGSNGSATATFVFRLLQGQEQPNAHTVTAAFSGGSTLASSSTSAVAPATGGNFLFQLLFDALLLQSLGF